MANAPKKTITLLTIQDATSKSHARRDWFHLVAQNIWADPDETQRLAAHECGVCYYTGPRQHTNSSTTRPCGVCDTPIRWGNGDVPVVCAGCAKRYKLCSHCGGTIDLRERRKFEVGGPS